MAILIDNNTKVLVQGITGKQGSFHTKLMLEYGTKFLQVSHQEKLDNMFMVFLFLIAYLML
jgi:succinyl-CoA synthetase alpha subunit